MEITLNTPGALPAIGAIRRALSPAMRVGAGTILGPDDARAAHEAGAEFIVTPTLQPETIAFCRRARPAHRLRVHDADRGAGRPPGRGGLHQAVPAERLGPGYVRALLAPLPFLKIIPTGGVSLDNLAAFLQAGSAASPWAATWSARPSCATATGPG